MRNFFLILACFFIYNIASAQVGESPWQVTLGFNNVDTYSTGASNEYGIGTTSLFGGLFDTQYWNIGLPSIGIYRSVYGGLSAGVELSLTNLNKFEGVSNLSFKHWQADVALRYTFLRSKRLSPSIKAGWGYSSFDNGSFSQILASTRISESYFLGAGLNIKLSDRISILLEAQANNAYEVNGIENLKYTASIGYGFGKGNDRDGDKIKDDEDECPDTPGLKEFNGCPDTDGDGIPDNKDKCPEEPGKEELEGCPDSDDDGVADIDDECVDVPGVKALAGCPDDDGDGIKNSEDKCPKEAGVAEHDGCPIPDKDGDGIPDADDECPDEAGDASTNGCPEEVLEEKKVQNTIDTLNAFINENDLKIYFIVNKYRIVGKKNIEAIDKISQMLKDNPKVMLQINGYASIDGAKSYNDKLSQLRAQSVYDLLVKKGIQADRMVAKGNGSSTKFDSATTKVGLEKNRLVVIVAVASPKDKTE